jgi:hypothetical protein
MRVYRERAKSFEAVAEIGRKAKRSGGLEFEDYSFGNAPKVKYFQRE